MRLQLATRELRLHRVHSYAAKGPMWRPQTVRERFVDFRGISGRLDTAKADFIARIAPPAYEMMQALIDEAAALIEARDVQGLKGLKAKKNLGKIASKIRGELGSLTAYGKQTVHDERERAMLGHIVRQDRREGEAGYAAVPTLVAARAAIGADSGDAMNAYYDPELLDDELMDDESVSDFQSGKADLWAGKIGSAVADETAHRGMDAIKQGMNAMGAAAMLLPLVSRALDGVLGKAANNVVNEAFNAGRGLGIAYTVREEEQSVTAGIYSALNDIDTCGVCTDLDGQAFAPTDPDFYKYMDGNPDCEGGQYGNSCRCMMFLEFADMAPPAPGWSGPNPGEVGPPPYGGVVDAGGVGQDVILDIPEFEVPELPEGWEVNKAVPTSAVEWPQTSFDWTAYRPNINVTVEDYPSYARALENLDTPAGKSLLGKAIVEADSGANYAAYWDEARYSVVFTQSTADRVAKALDFAADATLTEYKADSAASSIRTGIHEALHGASLVTDYRVGSTVAQFEEGITEYLACRTGPGFATQAGIGAEYLPNTYEAFLRAARDPVRYGVYKRQQSMVVEWAANVAERATARDVWLEVDDILVDVYGIRDGMERNARILELSVPDLRAAVDEVIDGLGLRSHLEAKYGNADFWTGNVRRDFGRIFGEQWKASKECLDYQKDALEVTRTVDAQMDSLQKVVEKVRSFLNERTRSETAKLIADGYGDSAAANIVSRARTAVWEALR